MSTTDTPARATTPRLELWRAERATWATREPPVRLAVLRGVAKAVESIDRGRGEPWRADEREATLEFLAWGLANVGTLDA